MMNDAQTAARFAAFGITDYEQRVPRTPVTTRVARTPVTTADEEGEEGGLDCNDGRHAMRGGGTPALRCFLQRGGMTLTFVDFFNYYTPILRQNTRGYPPFAGATDPRSLPPALQPTPVVLPGRGTIDSTLPLITYDGALFRGTSTSCAASSYTYNFDKSVWFSWQLQTAKTYGGNGCVVQYTTPPGRPLVLLDFWHSHTIVMFLYLIYRGALTPVEINAFQLYTGFGISKERWGNNVPRLIKFAWENELLDQNMRNDAFVNMRRPIIPNQYDATRGISWGSHIFDFDHSSTRSMDQIFSSMLARFLPNTVDGVAIRFYAPSTMHGNIHPEVFLFPGKALRLTSGVCRDPPFDKPLRYCPMRAGKHTRRNKKRKTRKVKNKKR